MIADGVTRLHSAEGIPNAIGGILLLAGLWTPVSGSVVGALGTWDAISGAPDFRTGLLIGTIGVALALLGPGMWSVDARLFGWRRIDLKER
jgi:uncharacterized membrane protein YphA (DoxX/SURF4 family)